MLGLVGSGYCGSFQESLIRLNSVLIGRTDLETVQSAENPRDIDSREYTVVIEPQAVGDFIQFLF